MVKNKKFIHLNDAFNYSKQNGLKILAINIKYFDAKINNYQVDKMNYLCLNDTDYYKFIKKEIEYIEVDNDKFNRTEKI
jgi:hypothetical protein